eukprot:m51a1_g2202 hypothetical protein (415) ;mRNA; r:159427-161178
MGSLGTLSSLSQTGPRAADDPGDGPRLSVVRVPVGGRDHFVTTRWAADGSVAAQATDGRRGWAGAADAAHVDAALRPEGLALAEYSRLALASLSSPRTCALSAPDGPAGPLRLRWSIALEGNEAIAVTGELELLPTERGGGRGVLSELAAEVAAQEQALRESRSALARARERSAQAQAQCEALVSAKERVEQDLIKRFLAVLNEKKRKIRELKADLAAARSAPPQVVVAQPPAAAAAASPAPAASGAAAAAQESRQHESEDEDVQQPAMDSEDEDAGMAPTFADAMAPTPSIDLLASLDVLDRPAAVRRRFRPPPDAAQAGQQQQQQQRGAEEATTAAAERKRTMSKLTATLSVDSGPRMPRTAAAAARVDNAPGAASPTMTSSPAKKKQRRRAGPGDSEGSLDVDALIDMADN